MIPERVPIIVGLTSKYIQHVSMTRCERIRIKDNPTILLNDHWHTRGNAGNVSLLDNFCLA